MATCGQQKHRACCVHQQLGKCLECWVWSSIFACGCETRSEGTWQSRYTFRATDPAWKLMSHDFTETPSRTHWSTEKKTSGNCVIFIHLGFNYSQVISVQAKTSNCVWAQGTTLCFISHVILNHIFIVDKIYKYRFFPCWLQPHV